LSRSRAGEEKAPVPNDVVRKRKGLPPATPTENQSRSHKSGTHSVSVR